jgi:PAS domain S-box-containing protein
MPLGPLQVLAVVLPLIYIAVLVAFVALADLPTWSLIAAGVAVSLPAVALFAAFVFGIIGRMRDELVRRESRFRSLLESAPDAIVIADRGGRIVMVNAQAEQVFGYAPGELEARSVEELVPDPLVAAHLGHRSDFHAAPTTRRMGAGLELFARRKDGSTFPAEISLSPIEADEGVLVTAVVRDVTERRRVEEERERLMSEREMERERQRIGMDLHDGIIQSIYAVGLNLEEAAVDVEEHPGEVQGRIDRAIEQLNDTIRDIRSYIFELRPTRFSGDLAESLQNLVQEFRVNSLIEVRARIDDDVPEFDGERASAVFHIAQEALNNVRKHAKATVVDVTLRRERDDVVVEVRDNGEGFDVTAAVSEDHRGLRNIASRAQAAGGRLSIDSKPGAGTTIQVVIPAAVLAGEGA